jgi:hypothetical protein
MRRVSRNGSMFRTDALCVRPELPLKKMIRTRYLIRTKLTLRLEINLNDAFSVNTVPSKEVTASTNVLPLNLDNSSGSFRCQISRVSSMAICDNVRRSAYSLHGTEYLPVSDSFERSNPQSDTSINGASD